MIHNALIAKALCTSLFAALAIKSGNNVYKAIKVEGKGVRTGYLLREDIGDTVMYFTAAVCTLVDTMAPFFVVFFLNIIFQLVTLKRNWRANK